MENARSPAVAARDEEKSSCEKPLVRSERYCRHAALIAYLRHITAAFTFAPYWLRR